MTLGGDVTYVDSRTSDFTADVSIPRLELPTYTLTDLRLSITSGSYTFTAFAKNIFDVLTINSAGVQDLSGAGLTTAVVGAPRTLGLSAAVDF